MVKELHLYNAILIIKLINHLHGYKTRASIYSPICTLMAEAMFALQLPKTNCEDLL